MQKTATRLKRDTKVTVSVEGEASYEEENASELSNSNDEMGVTYLYHRLQQRYWVGTEIAEVNSVVFVPETLPAWDAITYPWIRDHADVLGRALLDDSFASLLTQIRTEPRDLNYEETTVFGDALQSGLGAVDAYKTFPGGFMPDMLATGQQFYERDYERRNTLRMEQERRDHQLAALVAHLRRNILHYMRAIWATEDYDQRMQRYSNFRVPTKWLFRPYYSLPTPAGPAGELQLEVPGAFVPDPASTRPLTEVIDPVGPVGYWFNCAVFRVREDPRVISLHQALSYLRSVYAAFRTEVTVAGTAAPGFAVRQAVATKPRTFSGIYQVTYQETDRKWYLAGTKIAATALPDQSWDLFGVRVWFTGAPGDGTTLTVRIGVTAVVEDPHLRLVKIANPLPSPEDEPTVFTDDLLADMATVLPECELAESGYSWANLSDAQRALFRNNYHRFLMRRDSGRLVTLDTGNLVLDLEVSRTPALEQFKRLHRYVDVMKEYEEFRRRKLDGDRREALLKSTPPRLGDPDIEHVSVTNAAVAPLVEVDGSGGPA